MKILVEETVVRLHVEYDEEETGEMQAQRDRVLAALGATAKEEVSQP